MYVCACVCVCVCVCVFTYIYMAQTPATPGGDHLARPAAQTSNWCVEKIEVKVVSGEYIDRTGVVVSLKVRKNKNLKSSHYKKYFSKVVSLVALCSKCTRALLECPDLRDLMVITKKIITNKKIKITTDMTALVLLWLTLVLGWLFPSRVPTAR